MHGLPLAVIRLRLRSVAQNIHHGRLGLYLNIHHVVLASYSLAPELQHNELSTRGMLAIFHGNCTYQMGTIPLLELFVQRVAELATRPQKIEELQSAGVMQLLRPLLLDIVSYESIHRIRGFTISKTLCA